MVHQVNVERGWSLVEFDHSSVPRPEEETQDRLFSILGKVSDLISLFKRCNFSSRCQSAEERGRKVACLEVNEINE